MFCCWYFQHRLAFGYLYVPFCLIQKYPFGKGVEHSKICKKNRVFNIECILDF